MPAAAQSPGPGRERVDPTAYRWAACSQHQQEAESDVLRLLTGTMKADVTAGNLMLTRPDGTGLTLVEAR